MGAAVRGVGNSTLLVPVPEEQKLPPGAAGPGAAGKTATPAGAAGDRAQKLLKSLTPGGGLKNQAAILQFAAGLDAASARAAAMSSLGKGWFGDRNSYQLYDAVFTRWAELDPEAVLQAAKTTGDQFFRYQTMNAAFAVLANKDSNQAWETANKMGTMRNESRRIILNALSATDPQKAFDLASNSQTADRPWAMQNLMAQWGTRDPQAAGAATMKLPAGQTRNSAISGLASRWAASDFESATAWASALPTAHERVNATSAAIQTLSQIDPDKCLAALRKADVGNNRTGIINQAMSSLALRDFDGAMGRVSEFKNFSDKAAALGALAGNVTDENRDKLLKLAATLPANLARTIYEGGLWNQLESDPSKLVASLKNIPIASIREQAMARAVGALGYSQPEEAMNLFGKLQPVSQTPEVAAQVVSNLAWSSPEKAVEWAQGLGTEAQRKAALTSAIGIWAQTDPEKAGQEIAKISNPDTRAEITRSVADSLIGRSLSEAEKWASGLTGSDRTAALSKVVEQAASQDPDRVQSLYARFASGMTAEDAAKSENQAVARNVAAQLAQTDAAKAAAWALTLPEGGARDEASAGVVAAWAGYDAVAASQWVQNLPEGKSRDLATGNLVGTIARDDPESAWTWALSIGDDSRRREAAATALQGWKANGNREAAHAALDAAGFNDTDRQELMRKLQ